MLITERHEEIVNLINKHGFISSKEIMKHICVSSATLRRDLTILEKKGLIQRIRGGAMKIESKFHELSVLVREQTLVNEKKRMAESCVSFIQEGMSIFFDSSTSVSFLMPLLTSYKNISVVTNGITNALLCSSLNSFHTHLACGLVSTKTNSTIGPNSVSYLNSFNSDLFIFSCTGFSLKGGVTEANFEQSSSKQQMLKNSKTHILLVNSTKFGKIYMTKMCDLADLDVVITDNTPPQEYIDAFKEHNIKLIVASK